MNNAPKIVSVSAPQERLLIVNFSNGQSKKFNVETVASRPNYYQLLNYSFLKNAKVDSAGYSIYWNDEVDLCENELWNKGEPAT